TLLLPPRCTLFPYTTLFRSQQGSLECQSDVELFAAVDFDQDIHAELTSQRFELEQLRGAEGRHDEQDAVCSECSRMDDLVRVYEDRKSTRLNSSHVKISYAV